MLKKAINTTLTLCIIGLIGILALEAINLSESYILGNIGRTRQQQEVFVKANYENPKLLDDFVKHHPATQHRSIFESTKTHAYLKLIEYYQKNRQASPCISTAQELIKFWDQYYYYYELLGQCYLLQGDRENAYTAYFTAWNLKPNTSRITEELIALAKLTNHNDQIAYIQNIYNIYPKSTAEIQFNLNSQQDFTPEINQNIISDIPINNTPQNLSRQIDSKLLSNQQYLHIVFNENAGPNSSILIENITLVLDNSEQITFTDLSEWTVSGLQKTDIIPGEYLFNDQLAYISSPKLNAEHLIKNINIKIKYNTYEQ
ncbi:hypothetical protein COV81_03880 [Candidatus Peregrinibacteria bacterium CG11_big_fil_rev_8_21_14_0_20_41_10]|nr:MAG: hypothetical protein COV81_03880 [Candidatus Peregrinibacteria bacterium CG11_big_fil_rev_8_21_14_0_20_41_10]PJC38231.1 MAG: hypothetical protein CO045_01280 [Candidatus Peregrinibacteria bacterium CG_4_9_14_0_2_um_filter_41_14]